MDETALASLTSNANNAVVCSLNDKEIEQFVVGWWQVCREVLAVQMVETDLAVNYRISALGKIVREVGPQRFQEAVQRCLEIYSKPWDITIANVRRECGLDCRPATTPTNEAWELVTTICRKHVKRDENGNAILVNAVRLINGPTFYLGDTINVVVEPLPEIPESVSRAVRTLGGWGNLADAYPQWWGQKFIQWKEVHRP